MKLALPPLRSTIGQLGRVVLGVALLASATLAIGSPASAGATPADTASTHVYLQAVYSLDRALQGGVARRTRLESALATRIGGECPGVLASAPKHDELLTSSPLSPSQQQAPRTPRQRGEADLRDQQFSAIEGELATALRSGAGQAYAAPIAAFAATVTPLRWSNPEIAPLLGQELRLTEFLLVPAMPNVCVDISGWAASGFRALAPGTKALQAQQEAVLLELPGKSSIGGLLRPYEGPSERAIAQRTRSLQQGHFLELVGGAPAGDLRGKLGLQQARGELDEETPPQVKLGSGKTSVGATFTVTAAAGKAARSSCGPQIAIDSESSSEVSLESSFGHAICAPHPGSTPRPQLRCAQGVLQIESRTLAQTRHVRLLLSDGRTIDSAVVKVPAKLGGPFGVYFQMVRGPAPYPVSLTELDGNGQTLRSVDLPAKKHCRKRVARVAPTSRTIATGRTPGGRSFTIKAISLKLRGRRDFDLNAITPGESLADLESNRVVPSRYFHWRLSSSCAPEPYAVLYGQLLEPGDTVLAQTASGPVPLQKATIPSALHEAGTVAYGAFAALPAELIVQDGAGHTLTRESLAQRAHEEGEYCEGAAEPQAP